MGNGTCWLDEISTWLVCCIDELLLFRFIDAWYSLFFYLWESMQLNWHTKLNSTNEFRDDKIPRENNNNKIMEKNTMSKTRRLLHDVTRDDVVAMKSQYRMHMRFWYQNGGPNSRSRMHVHPNLTISITIFLKCQMVLYAFSWFFLRIYAFLHWDKDIFYLNASFYCIFSNSDMLILIKLTSKST